MVRLKLSVELHYEIAEPGADFIFNIHAAKTRNQFVVSENLQINQAIRPEVYTEAGTLNRYMRLQSQAGVLDLRYEAVLDIDHHRTPTAELQEVPVSKLPPKVIPYLYPSRYCQSDRLHKFAIREFGHLPPGHSRILAIRDWVRGRISFRQQASNVSTSAVDTLIEQIGVCRDFAHLMIALCRAVNVPARFVSGIDYGADPGLGPIDFHAYVEVYLGQRWYIFDPSGLAMPMGFPRFGTGRDAADVAFATIFGTVKSFLPIVDIQAVIDAENQLIQPRHCDEALSTDC